MRLTIVDYLLIATVAGAILVKAFETPAHSHEWYPSTCCSGKDCARVETIEMVPEGRRVTTERGTVIVPTDFRARESEDSDFHACIGIGDGENAPQGEPYLICWFEPKGS